MKEIQDSKIIRSIIEKHLIENNLLKPNQYKIKIKEKGPVNN